MDNFLSPAVIWFILGFLLFLLEFAMPGFILFFFAVGAWTVAIISLFTDLSVNSQLIIFLLTSVISVLLLRKWLKNVLGAKKQSSELIEDEFVGKVAVAETPIQPGRNGKVLFRGTSWDASSADVIEPGEQVLVTGNQSILLTVKSTKSQ